MRELVEVLGDAVLKPSTAEVVEDYIIFELREFSPPVNVEVFRRENAR